MVLAVAALVGGYFAIFKKPPAGGAAGTSAYIETNAVPWGTVKTVTSPQATINADSSDLIVPDLGYSIRQLFDGQFGGEGLGLFRRIAETNSFEALSALVKAGLGVGLRSRVGIQAEIARGELTFVPIQDRSFRSEKIAILVRNGRALPVAAAVLTERLVDALTSLALAAGQTESDDPTPMWPVQTGRRRARP